MTLEAIVTVEAQSGKGHYIVNVKGKRALVTGNTVIELTEPEFPTVRFTGATAKALLEIAGKIGK